MAVPFREIQASMKSRLRINPQVMRESVPQLTFAPSVGIVARDVDRLRGKITTFKEPLTRAIQQVVIPSIMENFEAEGRPPWFPYSEATRDMRENKGQPVGKLLQKTGALKTGMGQVSLWNISDNAAILLKMPVKYGVVQQEGYGASMGSAIKKAGGNSAEAFRDLQDKLKLAMRNGTVVRDADFVIPARPFVMLQPEDSATIEYVFSMWMQEQITKYWGKK